MVISRKHKFVFLRVPKNASTSVAAFLINNFCESDDCWTSIGDAKIQSNNVPKHLLLKYAPGYRFIHLTYSELIEEQVISPDQYQPIAIVRDPLDRQLSLFFFLNPTGTPEQFRADFAEGKHKSDPSNLIRQSDYIPEDANPIWWAYENIESELTFMGERLNGSRRLNYPLPTFKSDRKPRDNGLIDRFYDRDTEDAVRTYFARDFTLHRRVLNGQPY